MPGANDGHTILTSGTTELNILNVNISGAGEPLLVLHGWGMNQQIWFAIKQQLELDYQVVWVDLPGHGDNASWPLENLQQATDLLLKMLQQRQLLTASVDTRLHIMGWSMGGLLAQCLAQRIPQQIASLILVATTPSFVQRSNWTHAMPESLLLDFYKALDDNLAGTLKRFLLLQFMGVKGAQAEVRSLQERLSKKPADRTALQAGLQILLQTDLREITPPCPVQWILGALDKLIPVTVAEDLATFSGASSVHVMEGVGHAPFISAPDDFIDTFHQAMLALSQGRFDV